MGSFSEVNELSWWGATANPVLGIAITPRKSVSSCDLEVRNPKKSDIMSTFIQIRGAHMSWRMKFWLG